MAQKETTREKGQRLNAEGRVERRGTDAKGEPVYAVRGDSGEEYRVKKGAMFFFCPCPSRKGDCSHVEAVHAALDEEMDAAIEARRGEARPTLADDPVFSF